MRSLDMCTYRHGVSNLHRSSANKSPTLCATTSSSWAAIILWCSAVCIQFQLVPTRPTRSTFRLYITTFNASATLHGNIKGPYSAVGNWTSHSICWRPGKPTKRAKTAAEGWKKICCLSAWWNNYGYAGYAGYAILCFWNGVPKLKGTESLSSSPPSSRTFSAPGTVCNMCHVH